MEFVQIVEFETDQPEDIRTLMQQWHASMQPDGGPDRAVALNSAGKSKVKQAGDKAVNPRIVPVGPEGEARGNARQHGMG